MAFNRAFVLASRPRGAPTRDNFRLVESQASEPRDGEVLVKHLFLSLDPYMRGRMDDAKSYTAPQLLDQVMVGGTVGEVVASRNRGFEPGDRVVGYGGWQLYATSAGNELRKIEGSAIPLSAHLGVVGMPGVTAWYGLNRIIAPKRGDTVVVSAATGAVGSVVGQLAKRAGARTVGIAGGPQKCAHAVCDLGYDVAVDHRSPSFAGDLLAALPDGVDGLFENVGGCPFEAAMRHVNPFSRVAICGLIASYNGQPSTLSNMRTILVMQVRMQGFIVPDDKLVWREALAELTPLVASGAIKYRETVAEGLDAAPDAFLGLLAGQNLGKQVVRLV